MSKLPTKQTAYSDYLHGRICAWFEQGRGEFTAQELADFAGLKPTGNFYRRLRTYVSWNILYIAYEWSTTGKRRMVYGKISDRQLVE